ncbi:MAG: IS630 family transposase [Nitrosopumilus sp.]
MPYTGSRKDAERRRMRGMTLLDQGWLQSEVARKLGVTPAAVSQWVKARDEGGEEALRAKPHPGRRPKLNDRQLQQLEKLLRRGPRKHGYPTELWTLKRVAEAIQKRFGVHYEPSGVWHVLNRMGWSCQKPERRARERDEDAIAQWRQKDWPRIKKRATKR